MGEVAEQAVAETWWEVVLEVVVVGPWGYWDQDNRVAEAAFREDSLDCCIGSPEEETCVEEEDGIRLVHRMEAEGIDSYRTPAAAAGIGALEDTLESVVSVGEEQSSVSQLQFPESFYL